jgi:hypothetical protein
MSLCNNKRKKKSCKVEEERNLCKKRKYKSTKGIKKRKFSDTFEKNIKDLTKAITVNNQILTSISSNFKINRKLITNNDCEKKKKYRGRK